MNKPTVPDSARSASWAAPYWEASAEHRLVIQWCADCEMPIMYPKLFCPRCYGENLDWRGSAGEGEVYSFTVQVAGPPSGFEHMLPYVLAIIRLDEGVQLLSNIVGPGAVDVRCGDRVRVAFEKRGDRTLPTFVMDRA